MDLTMHILDMVKVIYTIIVQAIDLGMLIGDVTSFDQHNILEP